tara:strand:+ start:172 stop:495 length:324 start_codon:yes stop_codon:yes gene_type:complete
MLFRTFAVHIKLGLMTNQPRGLIEKPYAEFLVPGKDYRVTQAFLDAAGGVHPVGETWTYAGYVPNGFAEATYIYTLPAGGFAARWDDDPNSFCNAPQAYLQLHHDEA